MRTLLGYIGKEKHADSLAEKLALRFQAASGPAQWRNLAFCLTQVGRLCLVMGYLLQWPCMPLLSPLEQPSMLPSSLSAAVHATVLSSPALCASWGGHQGLRRLSSALNLEWAAAVADGPYLVSLAAA